IAPPIALIVLWPLVFQGVKLPVVMKNRPTVDMNTSGMNLRIEVHNWTDPMFFTPLRLIAAGIHNPIRARMTENHLLWSLLMNSATETPQPPTMGALPAQAVIQYSQAFEKPVRFPKATRA